MYVLITMTHRERLYILGRIICICDTTKSRGTYSKIKPAYTHKSIFDFKIMSHDTNTINMYNNYNSYQD